MKRLLILFIFSLYVAASVFAGDRELFNEAEGRFRGGNYAVALDLYERLINENRLSPYIPDAQFRRAVSYYQLGRYEEAVELFSLIRSRYPSTAYYELVPFWQGRLALEFEDYEKAALYFNEYIREGDASVLSEAYLYRALSYNAAGRLSDAAWSLELLLQRDDFVDDGYITALLFSLYLKEKRYNEILSVSGNSDIAGFKPEYRNRIRLYIAEAHYLLGNDVEAEKLYTDLIEIDDPQLSAAWQRLFTIYKNLGKDEQLFEILRQAEGSLASRPDILQDFRMRVGIASYKNGDLKTAKSYFLKIWDTSDPSVVNGLVPLYYSKILEIDGESKRAIELLEVFRSSSDDRRREILVRLAGLYSKSGDWSRAESRLDDFFRDYSESDLFPEAAYLKAYSCYKTGRLEEALEYVSRASSADISGERTASLLRLESTLLKNTGEYSKSVDKLIRYLELQPDDVSAGLDLLKIRFLMKDYETLLTEALEFKWKEGIRENNPAAWLLSSYMSGLSAIASSDYSRAVVELSQLSPLNTEEAGLKEIYPYALFYRGWAYYRSAEYKNAIAAFDELVNNFPDSDSAAEAGYLAGWSEYILTDYDSSSKYFLKYSLLSEQEDRGLFMYAKSLTALERYREAANIFAEIARGGDMSPLADDAVFEKAVLYGLMGDIEQASEDYIYLYRKYGGALAEEGMFRRAELFYGAERYAEAASSYYDFRLYYPDSKLYDAALYWGGMSLSRTGEKFGAALLWENIIDNYTKSAFRAPAMIKTAEVYSEAGDYSAALAMYERCRLEYPNTDRAAQAANESEKLRLLINGLSEREAELNVIITREGGSDSPKGRRAMIDLSALYISKGGSELKPALSMLREVVSYKDEDPALAAEAQFYIGEYYFRRNMFSEALKAYTLAAGMNPADRDFSAHTLYRAVYAAVSAGSLRDAEELAERLERFYPDSDWASEAEKLLKEEN